MPLVIPAERHPVFENFAGFVLSAQEQRIARETREHQEGVEDEAQNKKTTAIAGGVVLGALGAIAFAPAAIASASGSVAGIAAGTGLTATGAVAGASLTSILTGATLGARIGEKVGAGDVGGAIITGLQGVNQIIANEADTRKSEASKQLDFLKWGVENISPSFASDFKAAKAETIAQAKAQGVRPPTDAEFRNIFIQQSGGQLEQARFDFLAGKERARRTGIADAKTIQQFNAAPIDKATGQPIGYDFTPQQAKTFAGILADRDAIETDVDNVYRPAEKRRLLAANDRRMADLALKVKRTPQAAASLEELNQRGRQLAPGQSLPAFVGAKYGRGRTAGGVGYGYAEPGTIITKDGDPDVRLQLDAKANPTFHSRRREPNGKFYGIGEDFQIQGQQGLYQYTPDGKIELIKGTGPEKTTGGGTGGFEFEVDIAKTTEFVISGLEKGFDADQATIDKAVNTSIQTQANAAGNAAIIKQDLERSLRRRKIVIESESTEELFGQIKKEDPKFGRALGVVEQYEKTLLDPRLPLVSVEELEGATRYIAVTMDGLLRDVPMSANLSEELTRVMANLRTALSERKGSLSVQP